MASTSLRLALPPPTPKVARASQPWAGGQNAFGVSRKSVMNQKWSAAMAQTRGSAGHTPDPSSIRPGCVDATSGGEGWAWDRQGLGHAALRLDTVGGTEFVNLHVVCSCGHFGGLGRESHPLWLGAAPAAQPTLPPKNRHLCRLGHYARLYTPEENCCGGSYTRRTLAGGR